MAASSSPPAVARDSHHRHSKRESVAKRKRRDGSRHRDHHHERSKRHASSSDAAASSSSASSSSSSSSSDGASSDSGSSQSSSSSDDHRRRPQRRSSKRKHHHHRDESSSDSDSDGSERSRKHRRKDTSKKVKERRKEGSKPKDKKHRRKEKSKKDGAGPVQLSKFLGRDKDNGVRRSVVSGKKCLGVADTNEGGEDERRQIGRDKSYGTSKVFELQLRLNYAVLVFVDIVQFTAWSWYLIARNAIAVRLCCLFLDLDPLLDLWLPFQTKEFLHLASLSRALTPLALQLVVCCFLSHICTEGIQFSEILQHFGDCLVGSPALNHICYVFISFILDFWKQCPLRS